MRRRAAWIALALLLFLLAGCSGSGATEPAVQPVPIIPPPTTPSLVRLIDPLDEPDGYCVDVPGSGLAVQLDADLQADTCKSEELRDKMFTWDHDSGQMRMGEYDLCVEAGGAEPGRAFYLSRCSDAPLQRFGYGPDGTVRLAQGGGRGQLCLAIAQGEGIPTGVPGHLRRDLSVESCADVEPALSRWTFPGPTPP